MMPGVPNVENAACTLKVSEGSAMFRHFTESIDPEAALDGSGSLIGTGGIHPTAVAGVR